VYVMHPHNQLLSYMVSRHFISPNRWPIRCSNWLIHVGATGSPSCLCNNHNSALQSCTSCCLQICIWHYA